MAGRGEIALADSITGGSLGGDDIGETGDGVALSTEPLLGAAGVLFASGTLTSFVATTTGFSLFASL